MNKLQLINPIPVELRELVTKKFDRAKPIMSQSMSILYESYLFYKKNPEKLKEELRQTARNRELTFLYEKYGYVPADREIQQKDLDDAYFNGKL